MQCKAHLKEYSVKSLTSLDKSIQLKIIITEEDNKLPDILKELAIIKADELINLGISK